MIREETSVSYKEMRVWDQNKLLSEVVIGEKKLFENLVFLLKSMGVSLTLQCWSVLIKVVLYQNYCFLDKNSSKVIALLGLAPRYLITMMITYGLFLPYCRHKIVYVNVFARIWLAFLSDIVDSLYFSVVNLSCERQTRTLVSWYQIWSQLGSHLMRFVLCLNFYFCLPGYWI